MLLWPIFGCFVVIASIYFIGAIFATGLKCRRALKEFEKKSNGLPILTEGRHWYHNHTLHPVRKDINQKDLKLHQKYGETYGWLYRHQFCVSTIDLDLVKVLNHDEANEHTFKLKRDIPIKEWMEAVASIGGDEWRRVRKALAPVFAQRKIKNPSVMSEIHDSTAQFVNYIKSQIDASDAPRNSCRGPETNVHGALIDDMWETGHRYTMDTALRCFYGRRGLVHYDSPRCDWTETVLQISRGVQSNMLIHLALVFPPMMSLISWLSRHFHPIGCQQKKLVGFATEILKLRCDKRKMRISGSQGIQLGSTVAPHEESMPNRGSSALLEPFLDECISGKITHNQCISTGSFLLVAAGKTSSDTLAHTLYLIASDKRVQDKLRSAIRHEGGSRCEYLDWVLKESLRLNPPASIGCGRVTTREMRTKEGFILPTGTYIGTNAFVIHRLKKYWGEDANEFRPERWASTDMHHPFQYMPFGKGIRICPGRDFALMSLRLALTEVIIRFEMISELKPDAYHYDAPFWQTTLPYTKTPIRFTRIQN